jgi:hypothetical protein
MSDYVPEIDRLAAEYWKASDTRQGAIQIDVHRLGYSLKEWTDALKRNKETPS